VFAKPSLTFCLGVVVTLSVNGQNPKAVYIEAGGAGLYTSLNYDFTFPKNNNNSRSFFNGLKLGVGFTPKYTQDSINNSNAVTTNGIAFSFFMGYNIFGNWSLTGVNPNNFELGINATVTSKYSIAEKLGDFKGRARFIPSISIGYRHQAVDPKKIFWRLSYCPFYLDSKIHQWGGVAIGYSF
jgi:hypothetical protein